MSGRKIGILGGSFNPIHVGHISIAQQVGEKLGLDEVVLVPAGEPPHKSSQDMAPATDRLAMTRLAARLMARLSVSDVETRRSGKSYTIDTVRSLRESMGPENRYWFIIGADTVAELPTWHRAEELLQETDFAIAARPGTEADFAPVEENFGAGVANRLRRGIVEIDPVDASSTDIRSRIASGQSTRGLLRREVADYIKRNGLYRR